MEEKENEEEEEEEEEEEKRGEEEEEESEDDGTEKVKGSSRNGSSRKSGRGSAEKKEPVTPCSDRPTRERKVVEKMWPDLIQKAKDGGLDTVETYIFRNAYEPIRRQYNFKGNLDFVKFFKLVQEAGLYGILRLGPYVCAEWNYGGFPVWLNNIEGVELRTDNEIYKNEMRIFVTKMVDMCKEAKIFASQGGPIILAQVIFPSF
ncbi:hypothetical protein CXB51_031165 [Gossypium anomalum]|uniref:beta-galactosidase n=1 Tax=Gossypium anomalum TaxID=47600 RepID=A0A8J6CJA8_9ROSI|nr:hypothetical protein CXB51_031165 [Gossypium anomalum]